MRVWRCALVSYGPSLILVEVGCWAYHLLLQLEDSVHQRLRGWRATWYVDIDWHDTVATSNNTVGVVVVTTTVGARAHGDDPSWLWHLIVNLSQGRCHLIGEGSSDNHNIGLTWRGTENDTEAILIVTWCGQVHHLDGAARETEGHWP